VPEDLIEQDQENAVGDFAESNTATGWPEAVNGKSNPVGFTPLYKFSTILEYKFILIGPMTK
jgi:hypothetical protein